MGEIAIFCIVGSVLMLPLLSVPYFYAKNRKVSKKLMLLAASGLVIWIILINSQLNHLAVQA